MIYELRQYTIADGMREQLHELFEHIIGPLFEDVGIRTIAYWEPVAGTPSGDIEFVYLLGFDDMEAHERLWKAFLEHPRWLELRDRLGTDKPWAKVEKLILQSMPYSKEI